MEPKTPVMATDPNLQIEQAKAQKTLVDQLQIQAQGDTANLMARYGTRLALASSGMSTVAGATPSPWISGDMGST